MAEVEDKLKDYEIRREGEAEILLHKDHTVFYNPVQVHNRDMSIAVLRTFVAKRKEEHETRANKRNKSHKKNKQSEASVQNGEDASTSQLDEMDIVPEKDLNQAEDGIDDLSKEMDVVPEKDLNQAEDGIDDLSKEATKTPSWKVTRELKQPLVLEALAASGLRSLRYAREVDGLGKVVALDNDKASVESCKKNIKFNGASATSKVEAHLTDARVYMLTHPKEFDVVDLDPYGSPSIFLDSAVQAVADGGLLMCTATDMAVLCGTNGEVCYSKYGSYPTKGKYCHEIALRILLASIESHANRYKRYIVPVLSVFMDFYVRVFVRVFTSASEIKNTPLKLSYIYQCAGCDSFHLQSLGRTTSKVKNHPIKEQPRDSPGTAILSKSPTLEANFSRAVAALSKAQAKKVKRFLPNPERHWGPKVRAGRKITSKHVSLLGPEAINAVLNGAVSHEDGNGTAPDKPAPEPEGIKDDEPSTKRQKITDDEPANEP
ncbi:putative tRNA (guanine(26)-N(2))-dimethyltransferase 1 [Dichanthelium oligosanthes]|uniref:tRNA (guanine(26)-N(2))-dimethyltransferase n=1 Tax=Dichanthelium oligosanthes TaxID=888268 RepID=A0A1E5VWE6_9POAL|nr:putative tRNA (guanine(26)-N(2))-dimethyltransferase 1 [Dichanthelium oligosanthes]